MLHAGKLLGLTGTTGWREKVIVLSDSPERRANPTLMSSTKVAIEGRGL
jgi:hypothetical protein